MRDDGVRAREVRMRNSRKMAQLVARACVLLLSVGAAFPSQAENCSDYPGGVIDGFAGTPAPSQIQIDMNCTIRNYPASNALDTNFSFFTQPGQNPDRWLVVFDNVVHTGQMSCNSVSGHKIWFTNGSSTQIQEDCQNLLIPVEKIDKRNPAGQTTATVGVPFTYTLTMPVLFDAGTQTVINNAGSLNDLHGITVWDDLNATGADLTYLGHTVYWDDSGAPVPHTFSNVGGFLTFDNLPIVTAGDQMVLELTVVLEDTPANSTGTQFVNTAKWDFGRLIDGVFYEPLPGEWGITEPLTIAAPDLQMSKTGPATLGLTLNLGEWGEFSMDVFNNGLSEAWNVTLRDRLPDGPTGGMCDTTPEVLSAQVFMADGVTPVPGKGPLVEGTDYALTYDDAPTCELRFDVLSAAGTIGASERLVVTYRTQLDANSQEGVQLTNVAAATQWFNGDDGNLDRVAYSRPLTNGTLGVVDHEDAHTVTVALSGYFFEKTVENLTSGQIPAATAAPGDILRYTLRLQSTDVALDDLRFYDDLGVENADVVFEPGSLAIVPGTVPAGAVITGTDPFGGADGEGILDIGNLDLPASSEIAVQFDVTVDAAVIDGTVITNQADLLGAIKLADSDDPNVNGQADPDVGGDEDPTRVLVQGVAPAALLKDNTQPTAAIGEAFRYRVTVPSVPHVQPLYDVRVMDDLDAVAADLEFVNLTRVSGGGAWAPSNTGTASGLVIEDTGAGIDIAAGDQVVIDVTVRLLDTPTNVAGLEFTNTASYTYNLRDGDEDTRRIGDAGTTVPMTIVEPVLTVDKRGPSQMRPGLAGAFALDVHNVGGAVAYGVTIDDLLPSDVSGGMCDAAPAQVSAGLYEADGVTPVGASLVQGVDYTVAFAGSPACTLTVAAVSLAGAIPPDQRLIVSYETLLDAGTVGDATLTNVAGATAWFSADTSAPNDEARAYVRALTDGTVGVLDHEDAHTTLANLSQVMFEKTAMNVTTGQSPAAMARPGDVIRYSLRIENVGPTAIDDFTVVDELDRLNGVAKFEPGTLAVTSVPVGADTSNTNPDGGMRGSGLLHVHNLSLGLGEVVTIEFEATLAPVIANGSEVANQSQMSTGGFVIALSDDPNVNGAAAPDVDGDEDPTRFAIQSAPVLDVDKISSYLDGDTSVLLAGESLRYTIAVRNVGDDDAVDATIRDQIPANVTYVAGSTTLNGAPVADGADGLAPFVSGMLINSLDSAVAGELPADPDPSSGTVAIIEFDVTTYPDLVDGTVIANQAFVSAAAGGVVDQPSDDPRTPIADDPTRDVVGALPLLYAEKSAALEADYGSVGVVDPGDVLRYTIRILNSGSVDATDVVLMDGVPANTTYVEDTVTLNGEAIGRPDGGTFPLQAGMPVASSDLTPPVPGPGAGILTAGNDTVIQFDLRVDDGVPTGTLITNQAVVSSEELQNLLTDGDGNPATGPEPTVVVVGPAQQLTITKQVAVVGGGPALAGETLEYTVRVHNVGAVAALDVRIVDDLDDPVAGQLAYVAGSATVNGDPAGVAANGSVLSVDYGDLEPDASVELRFYADLDAALAIGTRVTNTATAYWNGDTQQASAAVSIDVGGVVGVGTLNGAIWHDADFDDRLDPNERLLDGWTIELHRNGRIAHTTNTGAAGTYQIRGLPPNYQSGDELALVFKAPGAGATSAKLGRAYSADFTNGLQEITDIVVVPGGNLLNLDLPIDPNGVVFDAVTRGPLAGVTLTLLDAASGAALPPSCLDDAAQQDQITRDDGYYKFDLNFSGPACPSGGTYEIRVTEPVTGYTEGRSEIIPPSDVPLDVPSCPGSTDDAVPATGEHCEVQPSELPPGQAVPAQSAGTEYRLAQLVFDGSASPGSAQVFNNHIPVDPVLDGAVAITKTTPMVNVTRGQLVPYTITVTNTYPVALQDIGVVDRYPPGFRYIEGSARIDGEPVEPSSVDREIVWEGLALEPEATHTIQLLLGTGAGVVEGQYVNRAQAVSLPSGVALSGEATATVRLVPDPTFDCTDVMGKVFEDEDRDGRQDAGEVGIGGVRLVTPQGLVATTDQHGRYHITCAIVPREDRGSNFVLKLDDRTLPSGFRTSSDQVVIRRATRGKTLRFNFGASIHRVVGLDIAEGVFVPDSTTVRPQWVHRFDMLLEELQKAPATLRLTYLADLEDPALVDRRLDAVKAEIVERWEALDCCYRLELEHDVFWRLGEPAKRAAKKQRVGRTAR